MMAAAKMQSPENSKKYMEEKWLTFLPMPEIP
jgi:hypothetical protein